MKVGSLVECVDSSGAGRWLSKGKIYTVRQVISPGYIENRNIFKNDTGLPALRLDEVTGPSMNGIELPFKITRFRELMSPFSISIESILEQELI